MNNGGDAGLSRTVMKRPSYGRALMGVARMLIGGATIDPNIWQNATTVPAAHVDAYQAPPDAGRFQKRRPPVGIGSKSSASRLANQR